MSEKRPINLKQDRRQWLKTSATILGTSLLPVPAIAVEVAQKKAAAAASKAESDGNKSAARFLTPAQYTLVEELSETIIPADGHSGGAKAAKVADYIEQTLRDGLNDERRANWREGLRLVDLMSQHYCGKSFVEADAEEKIAVLTVLSENSGAKELPEVKFFLDLRELTIQGYYTSKIGIHDELEYKGNVILMEYVGCDDPPTSAT